MIRKLAMSRSHLQKKDLHDFVDAFMTKIKQEQPQQNHAKPLGNNPLSDNELPNGNQPD